MATTRPERGAALAPTLRHPGESRDLVESKATALILAEVPASAGMTQVPGSSTSRSVSPRCSDQPSASILAIVCAATPRSAPVYALEDRAVEPPQPEQRIAAVMGGMEHRVVTPPAPAAASRSRSSVQLRAVGADRGGSASSRSTRSAARARRSPRSPSPCAVRASPGRASCHSAASGSPQSSTAKPGRQRLLDRPLQHLPSQPRRPFRAQAPG